MNLELPKSKLAKALLAPAALIYKTLVKARAKAYENGLASINKVEVPVISVGNITVGGTGKTPITMFLAKQLIAQGRKIAILSRGYNRKSKSNFVVASDGTKILCSVEDCGDEPYMMALEVPQAVVICGRSRSAIARLAIDKFKCDTLLLDDGFQHILLHRDINIALLDYQDDLETEQLLPAGRLREPVSALSRATHVVITKIPSNADSLRIERIKNIVRKYAPSCSIYSCRFKLENTLKTQNKTAVAFAGIARPDQFFSDLESSDLRITLLARLAYEDHHWYDDFDIKRIRDTLEETGSDIGLTTLKDLARLESRKVEPQVAKLLEKTVGVGLQIDWIGDSLILSIK
ncbi:MAG: tetraacyldisaccharide 4'-kinase [Candidatus Melainabacteria bacterium]|nr:tetraacyldisaccharide 4'-kinase [Candidatus Melainabacteria bacterium]